MSAENRSKPRPGSSSGEAAGEPSFEDMVAGLEAIIEKIEGGEIGLERSIAEYERGMGLIRRCKEILQRAEQKVEELGKAGGKDADDGA